MPSEEVSSQDANTGFNRAKEDIEMSTLDHVEDKYVSGIARHVDTARTPEEARLEKRFVRKVDFIILPLLTSMYFLASLVWWQPFTYSSTYFCWWKTQDRGDVGNAAVLGMTDDLHLTPHQLSTCISIFYVGYVLFQMPGYFLLRVIPALVQLGIALMFWGTFNTL
jgi:hypothetical protein